MKKAFLVWITAAILVLAGSAAWAVPTINIYDLGEGDPVVTDTGFPSIPLISNPVVVLDEEFATVAGLLTSNFIAAGSYAVKMLEPASEGGGVSDFATLTVLPRIDSLAQGFLLTFWSDGADGFNIALAAFNCLFPDATAIDENGTLQNLFTFGGLTVNAQSDVVPLPGSLLLLGGGLVGLALLGRRYKG